MFDNQKARRWGSTPKIRDAPRVEGLSEQSLDVVLGFGVEAGYTLNLAVHA